jgi:predicted nucleotidyltransferase
VNHEADALHIPSGLSLERQKVLVDVARRNLEAHGDDFLGLVLSGSAGRGIATDQSDLDVCIVLEDAAAANRETTHSAVIDEIPIGLSKDLEDVPPFGSHGWWFRWSFAWAPVVLDRTNGRLQAAVRRQATVSAEEARSILVDHDRLDGWLNYAYRAMKSDRDGRLLERRLDAAESLPWLLDVVFTLAGRVRPYHKYLPWELHEHPLPNWDAEELLTLLTSTLDGDPTAIRATFVKVETLCHLFDNELPQPVLTPVIDDWGDNLDLLRG